MTTDKSREYKAYITGLKGFACIMVMIGHFLGIISFAENMPIDVHLFNIIRDSGVGFFLSESYWLYLFFLVSGYLLSFSQVNSFKSLFAKSIQRFIRLGLPILFAYSIIFILYKTSGFHNAQTSSLFSNSWYQNSYAGEYSALTVIMSPIDVLILGKSSLNYPYWVLREMFLASVLIYFATYLSGKAGIYKKEGKWIVLLSFLGISFVISLLFDTTIVLFCMLGAFISWCERDFNFLKERQVIYISILAIVLVLSVINHSYAQKMFLVVLLFCVPRIKILNQLFSSSFFAFLGNISFGIYSFHWPLYCSLGAWVIIVMTPHNGLVASIIIAMVVSIALTILLSWLYHITCERLSGFLTMKIYKLLI